jgi:hypothetical protein
MQLMFDPAVAKTDRPYLQSVREVSMQNPSPVRPILPADATTGNVRKGRFQGFASSIIASNKIQENRENPTIVDGRVIQT